MKVHQSENKKKNGKNLHRNQIRHKLRKCSSIHILPGHKLVI